MGYDTVSSQTAGAGIHCGSAGERGFAELASSARGGCSARANSTVTGGRDTAVFLAAAGASGIDCTTACAVGGGLLASQRCACADASGRCCFARLIHTGGGECYGSRSCCLGTSSLCASGSRARGACVALSFGSGDHPHSPGCDLACCACVELPGLPVAARCGLRTEVESACAVRYAAALA